MRKFRLEKRKIIRKTHEFNAIFKNGYRVSSKHFIIFWKREETCKFGFTVSRKIRGSVNRNFAKRRLKEIVRLNQQHLPKENHLIFQAKPGIDRATFMKLSEEFRALLTKLKATQK